MVHYYFHLFPKWKCIKFYVCCDIDLFSCNIHQFSFLTIFKIGTHKTQSSKRVLVCMLATGRRAGLNLFRFNKARFRYNFNDRSKIESNLNQQIGSEHHHILFLKLCKDSRDVYRAFKSLPFTRSSSWAEQRRHHKKFEVHIFYEIFKPITFLIVVTSKLICIVARKVMSDVDTWGMEARRKIRLVAVTKKKPASVVETAYEVGQRDFGGNIHAFYFKQTYTNNDDVINVSIF